jgi:hypothetical protein
MATKLSRCEGDRKMKMMTLLVGGGLGIYMAVAAGAPTPQTVLHRMEHGKPFIKVADQTSACSTSWGTGAKHSSRPLGPSTAKVTSVDTGQHQCYDRLVVDLGHGAKPGYKVRYVRELRAQGSGDVIPLRGHAVLDITVNDNAAARFPASSTELADVAGYPVFRQLAGAGSFEGQTDMGIGTSARLPFRVQILNGPGHDSRLIIDVAHHR